MVVHLIMLFIWLSPLIGDLVGRWRWRHLHFVSVEWKMLYGDIWDSSISSWSFFVHLFFDISLVFGTVLHSDWYICSLHCYIFCSGSFGGKVQVLKDAVKAAQDVVDQLEPVNTGSVDAEGDTTNTAAGAAAVAAYRRKRSWTISWMNDKERRHRNACLRILSLLMMGRSILAEMIIDQIKVVMKPPRICANLTCEVRLHFFEAKGLWQLGRIMFCLAYHSPESYWWNDWNATEVYIKAHLNVHSKIVKHFKKMV